MRTQLMVMASLLGSLAVAEAAPATPKLAEVKAYVLDANGKMIDYSQDFTGSDVLLAVKITGAEPGSTVSLSFTATEDHSAAYAEAGKKAPPKKKVKLAKKATLQGETGWVQVPIQLSCYDGAQLTLGKSTLAVNLPGSCPV